MLQDALPWSEAIVFSNLQPDFKDEHQISKNIPADIAKGLIKVADSPLTIQNSLYIISFGEVYSCNDFHQSS